MWLDLLCLTFLGLGEPACIHGNSVSWSLGLSSRSSFHHWSLEHQELRDLNWSAQASPCCRDDVFLSDLLWAPLGQIFGIFRSSRIIVCTVPTLPSNCALIASIDTRLYLSMKFFIWLINSGVLTSLLLTHLSHPSQTSCLPWISYATQKLMLDLCKMAEKQSKEFHTFLWHYFHVYEIILWHILLLKCPHVQIAFLKFNTCNN